jgi:hypothetical protein
LTLSDINRDAYRHYRECRATGNFPDDPIVRRNAALIREQEDQASHHDAVRLLTHLCRSPH